MQGGTFIQPVPTKDFSVTLLKLVFTSHCMYMCFKHAFGIIQITEYSVGWEQWNIQVFQVNLFSFTHGKFSQGLLITHPNRLQLFRKEIYPYETVL